MPDLEKRFAAAQDRITTASSVGTDVQLQLYGLYKQATTGDVVGLRPGVFDMKARAKFDAWTARRGLSPTAAREAYVALVTSIVGDG